MHTKEIWENLYRLGNEAYLNGATFDEIKELLNKEGQDADLAYAVAKKVIADHYAERRKSGVNILIVGAVVIVSGFLITCINFHANESVTFAMYGLTSIGILIVFWGLYKIIG